MCPAEGSLMSSKLEDLDPDVQEMAQKLIDACAAEGVTIKITHTHRTFQEQWEIYQQGRSKPGKKVTSAPPGYSWHNYRRAFDVAIVSYPGDLTPHDLYDGNWEKIGTLAESLGLDWGGRWKHPDKPHLEHHGGETLASLRSAFKSELEEFA